MASTYELELTVSSAKDLKNVNWRHGPNHPYAVVWVDPNDKSSTKVDDKGDTSPIWDETLVIRLPPGSIDDATLSIDVLHAGSDGDTKPLIGSARLKLRDVLDEAGFGQPLNRSLKLKRPSGRPHGKVEVKACVRQPRYSAPDLYSAPPYGVPPADGNTYAPPQPDPKYATAPPPPAGGSAYGSYNAPPLSMYVQPPLQSSYGQPPPQSNYGQPSPQSSYGQPPPQSSYGQPPPQSSYYGQPSPQSSYGQPPPQSSYGQPPPQSSYGQTPHYGYAGQQAAAYAQPQKKKGMLGGMGLKTGLALGAVTAAVGGIALKEGFEHLEDKIADKAADKVEADLRYDEDDY